MRKLTIPRKRYGVEHQPDIATGVGIKLTRTSDRVLLLLILHGNIQIQGLAQCTYVAREGCLRLGRHAAELLVTRENSD